MYTEEMIKSVNTFAIKGSNQLKIGDRSYLQALANDPGRHQYFQHYTFSGQINTHPNRFALLRLSEIIGIHYKTDGSVQLPHSHVCRVEVIQADSPDILQAYTRGQYFPQTVKQIYNLTGQYHQGILDIETPYNKISYRLTNADNYGTLVLGKDHYGMILTLDFDASQFNYQQLQDDMLSLFREDGTHTSTLLLQQLKLRDKTSII